MRSTEMALPQTAGDLLSPYQIQRALLSPHDTVDHFVLLQAFHGLRFCSSVFIWFSSYLLGHVFPSSLLRQGTLLLASSPMCVLRSLKDLFSAPS